MLRRQQDQEYQETLLQDERIRNKKMEEEAAQAQREIDKANSELLLEAQKLSCELQRESTIERLRRIVSVEPAAGADVATVRFQLPSGAKLTRIFHKTTKMEDVSNYIALQFYESSKENPVTRFMMSTNYPKRDIVNMEMTIEAAVSDMFYILK